jgi:integrase
MGTVYKRGDSQFYWIKYNRGGKSYSESSKSTIKDVARKFLRQREGDIAKGKLPGVHFDKVTFEDIAKDFLNDYAVNKKKSQLQARINVDHLKNYFGGMKATEIDTSRIRIYIKGRIEAGAKASTINRSLSALRRMFSLAVEAGKLDSKPHFPMLKERNVRTGFFTDDDYYALRAKLPPHLVAPVTVGYRFGLRKGEVLRLTWDRINLKEATLKLERSDTKNEKGRTVFLDEELRLMIQALYDDRKKLGAITPYVFLNNTNTGPLKDFRGAWATACKEAGLSGRMFHDLRRSAVRNMVRRGVSENVAMSISGHKTRAIFDRYDIVSEADLKAATEKIVAGNVTPKGYVSATFTSLDEFRKAKRNRKA